MIYDRGRWYNLASCIQIDFRSDYFIVTWPGNIVASFDGNNIARIHKYIERNSIT